MKIEKDDYCSQLQVSAGKQSNRTIGAVNTALRNGYFTKELIMDLATHPDISHLNVPLFRERNQQLLRDAIDFFEKTTTSPKRG